MKDEHGFYNPSSIYHPNGSQYDAQYERFERIRTMEILFEFLDGHDYSDNIDVAEHLLNAKQAFIDRDPHHMANCIIAACRLAGAPMAIRDTDEWANQYAEDTKAEYDAGKKGKAFV